MKVLLSIKPEFANKIFDGLKKYEYRRSIFKRNGIEKIIVYASTPISKVVGEFEIEHIICDDLLALWDKTKSLSGISQDYFFKYFNNKNYGYAIKIKNCIKYDNPIPLEDSYGVAPPQSFVYVE